MVIKPKGVAKDLSQAPKLDQPVKETKGHKGHVAASDEMVKKSQEQGTKFSKRFRSGIKFLNTKFVDQLDQAQTEEGWEATFRDVISDILEKSGLNQERVVDFAFKEYTRFLKEHPAERERVKEEVTRLSQDIEDRKKAKKPNA